MKRFEQESVTIVDVLRHGQCEGGEIYRGSTDVVLTDLGWQQMFNAIIEEPAEFPWDRIITSPLKRCRLFAEHISQQFAVPLIVDECFREMNFGDWEGKPVRDVHRDYEEDVKNFYLDPSLHTPKNGEPTQAVQARVAAGFWRHCSALDGSRILFIQHGVTIRTLIMELLGLPLAKLGGFEIPYAGRVQFKIYQMQGRRRVVLSAIQS